MVKTTLAQYRKPNGKPTDSDFCGDMESNIKQCVSRCAGANKDIVSGIVNGALSQDGVHKGSAAIESVILTNERDMFNDIAQLLRYAHAVCRTHWGYDRTDMLSIADECAAIADQCDDDGRGGVDRIAEAEAAIKAKAETVNAVTGMSDRIIMAAVNGDADSIKAVIAGGASEDLVKALIMSVTGDQPKRKQTAFLKACDLS